MYIFWIIRITSYNVCYTKLLRALKDINNCPSIKIVYTYENIEIPIDIKLHFSGHEFFPMVFRVSRRSGSGGFQTEIDFQSSLFSEDFVNGFFMNYKSKVLEIVCSTDDSNVIIRNQNYNYHQTLHTIFEQNIANFSNKVAVSFFNENLTYYELNNRANYIAHKLIEFVITSYSIHYTKLYDLQVR